VEEGFMNNTVVSRSLLTRVFVILIFLPVLAVSVFGQAAVRPASPTPTSSNQSGDEAFAIEDLAAAALTTSKIANGAVTSSQTTSNTVITSRTRDRAFFVCEDCCGPKLYQSQLWLNNFGRNFTDSSSAAGVGTVNAAPAKLHLPDRVVIDGAFGFSMKSVYGPCWELLVSIEGALVVTSVTCP
jgi:hypothetical protein